MAYFHILHFLILMHAKPYLKVTTAQHKILLTALQIVQVKCGLNLLLQHCAPDIQFLEESTANRQAKNTHDILELTSSHDENQILHIYLHCLVLQLHNKT